jgi:hypothetical protein
MTNDHDNDDDNLLYDDTLDEMTDDEAIEPACGRRLLAAGSRAHGWPV